MSSNRAGSTYSRRSRTARLNAALRSSQNVVSDHQRPDHTRTGSSWSISCAAWGLYGLGTQNVRSGTA